MKGMHLLWIGLLLGGCSEGWGNKSEEPGTVNGKPDTGPEESEPLDSDSGESAPIDTDTGPTAEDLDRDGFSSVATGGTDCDDGDAAVYPGALELCDGKDNDCDGLDDAAEDSDSDGIGDCYDYCPVYALWGASGDGRELDPIGTLQEAIELAGSSGCNEVRANKGTFYENIDFLGWPVNMESLSGPETTVIDGGSAGSVVSFITGETDLSRIYGFTLTNGAGDGGGVAISYSSPTVEGNIITANIAVGSRNVGGGIWIYEGSPQILDNEISNNGACFGGPEDGCDGGGIDIRGGTPYIAGNWIIDNLAGDGGGIWMAYSDAIIVQNVIAGNLADDSAYEDGEGREKDGQGGGINVQIGGPTGPIIAGNVIADNIASALGGGIVTYEDYEGMFAGYIYNNTIVYNLVSETDNGAGFCQWDQTAPAVFNNIIAYNSGVGAYAEEDINAQFTYNLVYGNNTAYGGLLSGTGTGNLSADPSFVRTSADSDWSNDDFHLSVGSPAIDVGDPLYYDADGSPGDLGAYGGPYGNW
jgi:hypothetical protein